MCGKINQIPIHVKAPSLGQNERASGVYMATKMQQELYHIYGDTQIYVATGTVTAQQYKQNVQCVAKFSNGVGNVR